MSETETGAFAGVAQGAAAGAAFGPWGAVIGGVIGGIGGLLGGKKKKQARKFAAKAAEMRRRQQQMRLALQRRDIIREQRIARAQAVAAGASESGVTSSAVQGAGSAITSQGKAALSYFDSQVGLDNAYQNYAKKAGKAAGDAAEIFTILGAAGGLVNAGADIYGLAQKTPVNGGQQTAGYTSFNNTAAVDNMTKNSAFQTFGSTLNLSN